MGHQHFRETIEGFSEMMKRCIMHEYDSNYVGWLFFFAMKAKSHDTDAWRRENYRDASLREIKVRQEYNTRISMKG